MVQLAVWRMLSDMSFEEKQSLGQILRQKREAKNWTQEHLAGASGVPLRSVQRAEKGEGIGKENLSSLASAFGIDVQDLLRKAKTEKEISPELRLSLQQITKPEDLIGFLMKKGNFHFGPPGEDSFNEYLGEQLIDLQSEISSDNSTLANLQKLKKKAAHVIAQSKHLGFFIFAVHYQEEFHRQSKLIKKPTTIIIATHQQDQRIKKTSKGFILDYIMDSRRQMLAQLGGGSPFYDWMQDQLISKLDGKERVGIVLKKMNDRISKRNMNLNSRSHGATIRDYAKSQKGKAFLNEHFNLAKFSRPNLSCAVELSSECNPNVLGVAFDQLLLFLLQRQSDGVEFEHPLFRVLPDRRCREARNIKHYLTSGKLSDELLDNLVQSAVAHQKSYLPKRGRPKGISFIEYRTALKSLYDLAMRFSWSAKQFLYHGSLADFFAVSADFIMDDILVEVKTTKDAHRHSEHIAQLLAYYLVSQSPTRKSHEFQINELAIYYARHGECLRQPVAPLLRFPKKHLKRVAFDFLVGFQFWSDYGCLDGISTRQTREFSDASFNRMLKAVYPRPDWLTDIFEAEDSQNQKTGLTLRRSRRIQIPDDFLIEK